MAVPQSLDSIHGGLLIKTVNQMGFMNIGPSDEYVNEFVRFSATADGPVADLGCAFGHKAKLMLDAGAKCVIANDLAAEHLEVFGKTLTPEEKARVILIPGDAIKVCSELSPGTLSGVLACNWLHFLKPADARKCFGLFYRILKPGGMLTVVTASTYCGLVQRHQDSIAKRKADGDEWPGLFTNEEIGGEQNAMLPDFMHFLDPEHLVREAKLVGFQVIKASSIARKEYPDYYQMDGREASGLIAFKPKE